MGFSENAAKRAALATANSGPDAATNWIFGHMEDADLNDPIVDTNSSGGVGGKSNGDNNGVDQELVQQICQMGFSPDQATFALKQPGNGSPDLSHFPMIV